jgi:hypothetical protein
VALVVAPFSKDAFVEPGLSMSMGIQMRLADDHGVIAGVTDISDVARATAIRLSRVVPDTMRIDILSVDE